MDFFAAMDILASGLSAERTRLNMTASNLANARTTRTAEGGPYKRRDPVFAAQPLGGTFNDALGDALRGVEVTGVSVDNSAPRQIYDPAHPDADARGYVAMPNVNTIEEMVNMLTAARAYEAGTTALRTVMEMAERALSIGK